ncbi:MAG: TetR/AcrR family transcriptional regulator [Rhodospirillales bacterium]|nr:TetR/AcrR family transcriptional regulator [Rhodospirillales bacterium]
MTKRTRKGEIFRAAIIDAAARLFIERGFLGTNIQDVANALGVTRTAVYYYFKNKGAILDAITEDTTFAAKTMAARLSADRGRDPTQALRGLMAQQIDLILASPMRFRVSDRDAVNLSPKKWAEVRAAWRGILESFTQVIERGVAQGQFDVVNARVAAFAVLGMCNWTARWYKPGGGLGTSDIIAMMTDMALKAVRRPGASHPAAPSLADRFRLLHADVNALERLLTAGGDSTAPRPIRPAGSIDAGVKKSSNLTNKRQRPRTPRQQGET